MSLLRVIGIDLALSSSGVADAFDGIELHTIRTAKDGGSVTAGRGRLRRIIGEIGDVIDNGPYPRLVVVEGPSYGSVGAGTWDRAGLWWLLVDHLLERGNPVAVAAPALVKKYATGVGGGKRAGKTAVASAVSRRYGREFYNSDVVDAFVLCCMGLDYLGHPPAAVPKIHREALAKVAWPELETP